MKNLQSNGYQIRKVESSQKNGTRTVLSNGASTYTVYTRSSTGESGAHYFGPEGQAKFTLDGQ